MSIRSKVAEQIRKLEKPFAVFNEITISRSAILHNFDFFSSLTNSGQVIPVLKSNAYGHGIAEVVEILKDREPPYIAVDGYYEGLVVRDASRKQAVLVMGAIQPDNFKNMSFRKLAFVVHDEDTIEALARTGRKVKVHIEIDTGMTRHGIAPNNLPDILALISRYKNLEMEGVMSHLADADNPTDNSFTDEQARIFDSAVELIQNSGFRPKYIHIAQSAGSVKVKSKYANTLRIGIALYGISPLEQVDTNKGLRELRPALSLTSAITKINTIEKGTTVSYGRTYTANSTSKIGIIPLGYYEGLPRALSNKGQVKFNDSSLPIVGRVCMNHAMINLKNSAANVGDKVTIISSDINSKVSVDAICKKHNLFNYGLLVGLNQNVRRKIVD